MTDTTEHTTGQHATAAGDREGSAQFFSEKTRRELLEEDRIAWRNVCGVLFSIVFCGLLLGLAGVLLATWN